MTTVEKDPLRYKHHFRVEATAFGPAVLHVQNFPDLLDQLKEIFENSMPGRVQIEYLRDWDREVR